MRGRVPPVAGRGAGYRRDVDGRAYGRGVLVACVLAVGVAVGTTACGAVPDAPSPTVPSTVAPAPPAVPGPAPTVPGAGDVRDAGVPLGDPGGAVLLPAGDGHATLEGRDDGATAVGVTGPAGALARVAPPRGGSVEPQADGSVVVRAADGAAVAALAAPAGDDGAPAGWRVDGDVLVLDGGSGGVAFVVGTAALASATWGEAEGGRSLAVVPAGWVRGGSLAAQEVLTSQLVAAEPEAGSASMRAQLWCHALGAPGKDAWNLEPWRPDVGTVTLLATRCNPTDDDA